ncbi:MAG: hypothetical protein MUC42_17745 [Bryobacter sp.]|nr:hypothetical protein [Bryobacter sp.]
MEAHVLALNAVGRADDDHGVAAVLRGAINVGVEHDAVAHLLRQVAFDLDVVLDGRGGKEDAAEQ